MGRDETIPILSVCDDDVSAEAAEDSASMIASNTPFLIMIEPTRLDIPLLSERTDRIIAYFAFHTEPAMAEFC